ncbi:MAG: cytochrome c oxidase assembly protein [Proteobacteria bacterium]|nr:cytochrome c oxidase assembly protein [Pseudomonadota bacterium]
MNAGLAVNYRQLVIRLALFALLMFGFGYALIPFYKVFCDLSGLNLVNLTSVPQNTQVDAGRLVSIEFDTNVHDLPWQFRPVLSHISVHPGEISQVEFEVVNNRNVAVTGQAIPSFGPRQAGEFFKKLSCFCFEKQTLAAGETRRMPVVFMVDANLPKDIATITLSYTFFEVEGNQRAEVQNPKRRS